MPKITFITQSAGVRRLSQRGSFWQRLWRLAASRGPRVPKGTTGITAIIITATGTGGYYRAPPVVYGTPYYAPPVVYGSPFGLNINIR